MSEIKKEEMFGNLKSFLKSKGIEIQEGSYASGIRRGCDILTDTVNMSQRAFERTKTVVGQGLNQARQTVHEYTAPKAENKKAEAKTKTTPKKKTAKGASPRGTKRGK